jgi:hypothetical protein
VKWEAVVIDPSLTTNVLVNKKETHVKMYSTTYTKTRLPLLVAFFFQNERG